MSTIISRSKITDPRVLGYPTESYAVPANVDTYARYLANANAREGGGAFSVYGDVDLDYLSGDNTVKGTAWVPPPATTIHVVSAGIRLFVMAYPSQSGNVTPPNVRLSLGPANSSLGFDFSMCRADNTNGGLLKMGWQYNSFLNTKKYDGSINVNQWVNYPPRVQNDLRNDIQGTPENGWIVRFPETYGAYDRMAWSVEILNEGGGSSEGLTVSLRWYLSGFLLDG